MNAQLTRRDLFEQVSDFEAFGYSNSQIARALGIAPSTVTDIQSNDDYQNILAEKTNDRFSRAKGLADGWDAVEALALNQIVEALQQVPDADYALRAAAIANKAARHGHNGNTPIVGGSATGVIKMQFNFINQMNVNGSNNEKPMNGGACEESAAITVNGESRKVEHDQRKTVNMLDPSEAEKILNPNADGGEEQTSPYAGVLAD